MDKPVYAIVCGTLRHEFEFFTTVLCLCERRKQGYIQEIILSTWEGEDKYIHNVKEKMDRLGVTYLETPEPENQCEDVSIVYLRQALQLKRALDIIPNDVYVLKCRTDYSNFDINRMDIIYDKRGTLEKWKFGAFDTNFEYKISVLRFSIGVPFSFHDICFLGYKNDLKKLINMCMTGTQYRETIIPDLWFFVGHFAGAFPVIDSFCTFISFGGFHAHMNNLKPVDGDIVLPRFLNRFYATYFSLIYTSFNIFHDSPVGEDKQINMADIFCSNFEVGIRKDWVVETRSMEVLKRICEGRIENTKGYQELYSWIERIKNNPSAVTDSITMDEYKELVIWGEKYLGADAIHWLKSFDADTSNLLKASGTLHTIDAGKEEEKEAHILFDEYNVSQEVYNIIRDISFNDKSYYSSIIDNLEAIKHVDYKLYKKALYSSARYFDDRVLLLISELLLEDCNTEAEKREATYMFQRFADDVRLYRFPMSDNLYRALENYCTYERCNESEPKVMRGWIDKLVAYLGYEGTVEYTYAFLDSIKNNSK